MCAVSSDSLQNASIGHTILGILYTFLQSSQPSLRMMDVEFFVAWRETVFLLQFKHKVDPYVYTVQWY